MIKKFLKNKSGNIAILTGILAIPLFGIAGAALDYGVIFNKRSGSQNGLDAAILSAGTRMSQNTDSEVREDFANMLKSNLTADQFAQISATELDIDREDGRLHATLKSGFPTTLLQVIGIDEITFSIQSEVQVGSPGGAEVVLALDTTGSMLVDNKIGALKTVATNFTNEMLSNNRVDDNVKIGIVPFGQYVNVGVHNRNANWLQFSDDGNGNICRIEQSVLSRSSCVSEDRFIDGVNVGEAQRCSSIEFGPEEEICYPIASEWEGCVGSRDEPLNIHDGSYVNRVPAVIKVSCGAPILPLTTRKSDALNAISDLNPVGETYMAAGMTWALRTISDDDPFRQGISYQEAEDTGAKKIIVLMTDGENTRAPREDNFSSHSDGNPLRANAFTLQACSEAKSNDILVYTIGFGEEITTDTATLLQDCATTPQSYFAAEDAQALQSAFNTISAEINSVFLSQ